MSEPSYLSVTTCKCKEVYWYLSIVPTHHLAVDSKGAGVIHGSNKIESSRGLGREFLHIRKQRHSRTRFRTTVLHASLEEHRMSVQAMQRYAAMIAWYARHYDMISDGNGCQYLFAAMAVAPC
jgi:hypothetical protein